MCSLKAKILAIQLSSSRQVESYEVWLRSGMRLQQLTERLHWYRMMKMQFLDELPDIGEVRFSFGRRNVETKAKNYVIYCRESDERHDSAKSIPAQLEQCLQLALRDGLHVLHIVKEKMSARHYDRPRFNNLLKAIKGMEELNDLPKDKRKLGRPDGIIAWHPDRLARNMRDAGEIIELLDGQQITEMEFVMYSFHNDSSGKEHLAMEFARAKGYSDHLQENVMRGLIEQEMKGKGTKPLSPAFEVIRKEDETHNDHLKIVATSLHHYWRDAYTWKLEGKTNDEIAKLLVQSGYSHRKKEKGRWYDVTIDKNYIGLHIKNPIHCGWLVPKKTKEPRKADLTKIYPLQYGEDFPIVVTVDEFKRVNPNMFKDTAKQEHAGSRRSKYPLASNKVFCALRHEKKLLATMTPNKPTGGSQKPSPRFTCQRCKPSHSIYMETIFDAIGEKLKEVKLTEREHKILVVTEWHEYKQERLQTEATERQLAALKASNKKDIEESEERLNAMKYSKPRATEKECDSEERKLKRLREEKKSLLSREGKLDDEGMRRYEQLDAFLELASNGSNWWKKATDEQKRQIADLVVSNVVINGDNVASVSLAEPFNSWSLEKKVSMVGMQGLEPWVSRPPAWRFTN